MIEIHPYESVGPVAFGVSADRVLEAFGEPAATSKDRRGNLVMRFQGLSVTIAESGVVEFGLLPESSPRIFGIDIFASPNAFHGLCEKDGSPSATHEVAGSWRHDTARIC